MQKNMSKLGTVLMAAVIAAWVGGWVAPAVADAPVEQTGQTQCWDRSGNPIDCAGTGQDGEIQAGHPLPTPRFVDEGDGTVEDKLTDLIWLKDASCLGFRNWPNALAAVARLNAGEDFECADYGASTFDDWRLPNFKELLSLIHFGFFDPALSNALGDAKWAEGDAFSGVQSAFYWTSTTQAGNPDDAWRVRLFDGNAGVGGNKANSHVVWAVRGGQ